ncbi:hypothetical protein F5I97DRAFT_1002320 [Phlebopus sp. FC_14]|nr:hypothetical protein F5I97DRAFT_1002320 [Phlebopus sp. FC_14]
MSNRRTLTPDGDLLSTTSGAPAPSRPRTSPHVFLDSTPIPVSSSSTTSSISTSSVPTTNTFGFSLLPTPHHYSQLHPPSAHYPSSTSSLFPSSLSTQLTHPPSSSSPSGTTLPTLTPTTSATATTSPPSAQPSMIVPSSSFYDPAQASSIPPPEYHQLSVWDAAFDPGNTFYAQGVSDGDFDAARFGFAYSFAQGQQGQSQAAQSYRPILPAPRRAQRGVHGQAQGQGQQRASMTSQSLARQRTHELLNQTHIHPPQGPTSTQEQQQRSTDMYTHTQTHVQNTYPPSGSTTTSGEQSYGGGGGRQSDSSDYSAQGSADGYYYHDTAVTIGGEADTGTGMYQHQYAVQQVGVGLLPTTSMSASPHVPSHSQTHMHPQSHPDSPPFATASFTPPMNTHTPTSDSGGIYALSHSHSSHGSLSPASYASYLTGTGTDTRTSSSLDEASGNGSGPGTDSASGSVSGLSGVSGVAGGDVGGTSSQGSHGHGGVPLHVSGPGHGHSASVDTVVGRSPPLGQGQGVYQQPQAQSQPQRPQTGYAHSQTHAQPTSRSAPSRMPLPGPFGGHQQLPQQINPHAHALPQHPSQPHAQGGHPHPHAHARMTTTTLPSNPHSSYRMSHHSQPHTHTPGPFAPPPPLPAPALASAHGSGSGSVLHFGGLAPLPARSSKKRTRPPKRLRS